MDDGRATADDTKAAHEQCHYSLLALTIFDCRLSIEKRGTMPVNRQSKIDNRQ
jgi:hypothetical protein